MPKRTTSTEPMRAARSSTSASKPVDNVSHPPHYTQGKLEVIEIIEEVAQFYTGKRAAMVAQVIKYLARAPHKGNHAEDIKKAQWYMNRLASYD